MVVLPPAASTGEFDRELPRERSAEELEQQAAQRASVAIRRSLRANRARFMWTFTYREATYDYGQLLRDVAAFQERLRAVFGPVYFLLVPEPHPGGHGWHAHGATNRFLSIEAVRKCWPHGHVWVGDDQGEHAQWSSRKLARYLAKYVTKGLGADELAGCTPRPKRSHRYWVTQGFEPRLCRMRFTSLRLAEAWLENNYGRWDHIQPFGWELPWPMQGFAYSFPDECLEAPPGP